MNDSLPSIHKSFACIILVVSLAHLAFSISDCFNVEPISKCFFFLIKFLNMTPMLEKISSEFLRKYLHRGISLMHADNLVINFFAITACSLLLWRDTVTLIENNASRFALIFSLIGTFCLNILQLVKRYLLSKVQYFIHDFYNQLMTCKWQYRLTITR